MHYQIKTLTYWSLLTDSQTNEDQGNIISQSASTWRTTTMKIPALDELGADVYRGGSSTVALEDTGEEYFDGYLKIMLARSTERGGVY